MGRSKIDGAKWRDARAQWEGESHCSLLEIASLLEISKQAVHKHAKKNGWTRQMDMRDIARKAHLMADSMTSANGTEDADALLSALMDDAVPPKKRGESTEGMKLSELPTESMRSEVRGLAVDRRTEIIDRHRREWDGARRLVYQAINAADFDRAKLAKITSEAIKIVQDGERKAWNLDIDDASSKPTTIVIERHAGSIHDMSGVSLDDNGGNRGGHGG